MAATAATMTTTTATTPPAPLRRRRSSESMLAEDGFPSGEELRRFSDALSLVRAIVHGGVVTTTTAVSNDSAGISPLHTAAFEGKLRVLRFLLENGANIHFATPNGWTALHVAAHQGDAMAVSLLLDSGADVFRKTNGGQTALDIAKKRGFSATVQMLATHIEKTNERTAAASQAAAASMTAGAGAGPGSGGSVSAGNAIIEKQLSEKHFFGPVEASQRFNLQRRVSIAGDGNDIRSLVAQRSTSGGAGPAASGVGPRSSLRLELKPIPEDPSEAGTNHNRHHQPSAAQAGGVKAETGKRSDMMTSTEASPLSAAGTASGIRTRDPESSSSSSLSSSVLVPLLSVLLPTSITAYGVFFRNGGSGLNSGLASIGVGLGLGIGLAYRFLFQHGN